VVKNKPEKRDLIVNSEDMRAVEAEVAVIAALMYDNLIYEQIAGLIKTEHFVDQVHRDIFATLTHLIERGQIASAITIWPYFMNNNIIQDRGGEDYFKNLCKSILSISYVLDYAKQVRDMYLRRELFKTGSELQYNAHNIEIENTPDSIIEECENTLFALSSHNETTKKARPFSNVIHEVIMHAKDSTKSDFKTAGVATGFADLDRHMGGMHPSDLIILAGRPSMGKTALATNIAFFVARSLNDGVIFFSLEMSDEQLATRILGQEANIPSDRIRRGMISQNDLALLTTSAKNIAGIPLYIDDTPSLSVAGLRTRARRITNQERKKGKSISLIVIDYLQLLTSGGNNENRVQELSFITRSLKAMSKELNVPVLALSQLSRAVEQRDDRRPQLSDLRESGTIEQDADVVMFVFREEYYEARKKPGEDSPKINQWKDKMEKIHNLAELIIAKQRHGPITTITLHYQAEITKFSNYIAVDFK
jgi:replicative DNA helicase